MAGKTRRTTHRSVSGTKLYAVRDAKGRFKDIQTYKRAHSQDIKRKSKKENRLTLQLKGSRGFSAPPGGRFSIPTLSLVKSL